MEIETLMVLIPALPLAAAAVIAALGKRVLREKSHLPAVGATVGGFALSLMLLWQISSQLPSAGHGEAAEQTSPVAAERATNSIGFERTRTLWTWADVGHAYAPQPGQQRSAGVRMSPDGNWKLPFKLDVTLRADPLSSIMLCMVLFISSLVVIYASGYMHGDEGYWRFFAYVSLFVFSMTMLVSVSNFALLYVFWEAVGVCSYLLIGFWFEKPEAAAAGKKAFLVNRVGDFGFALGVFLIWTTYGTLNFHDADGVWGVLGQLRLANEAFIGGGIGLAICLCLMLGACGKSAQFPLHVWLPDAMEGPTPVSALIHAATMVTAGVYMVTRCTPLFFPMADVEGAVWQQGLAQTVVAVIGMITALLAGLIALTQTDLKRVLAYSTISQLGYMFLALGTGSLFAIYAGMFHLFTHAFFKSLLFLGAGSVMHAMGHVIDMQRFSGLRRIMPWTHRTFLFGCLALAGIAPFAGFWSKDAIVAALHERAHHGDALFGWLYWGALLTAFLTAFYTFRAYFSTFYGPLVVPPEAGHHAHESPPAMVVPLAILAVCSLAVGGYFEWTHGFAHYLAATPSLAYGPVQASGAVDTFEFHAPIAITSTLVAAAGIGLAAFLYLGERRQAQMLASITQRVGLYSLSHGKFYFDQIYQGLIVWPLQALAGLCYWVDRQLVDGLVNITGRMPAFLGAALRPLQGGLVQFYALFTVLGLLVVMIGTLLLWQKG